MLFACLFYVSCVADVWWVDVVLPVDAVEFSAVVDFFFDYVH